MIFRKYLLLAMVVLMGQAATAQEFADWFNGQALRIDYIFTGDAKSQEISLDQLSSLPKWNGKRRHLSETPMEGNAQISVYDHRTQALIYKNSFSTLFQEWLSYPEALTLRRSFENVLLIPYPKDTIDVRVDLRNNRREITASLTHTIAPNDILIRPKGTAPLPYDVIVQARDTAECINIAFVAEGYKDEEMPIFLNDVNIAVDALFRHEPFKSNREAFNIVAVKAPSADSDVSIPHLRQWKTTAVSSHFDTFYMDRYLTTLHLKQLHDVLAGTPYDHIIVLANTSNYGGGGILNFYNLAMTHHPQYQQVVVHEFGHSFAGLADEYAYENEDIPMYPHDVEPWEPNITTLADFTQKWSDMIGNKQQVGLYEGAGYSLKGIYRPCEDCRMRSNVKPDFCPVCQKAIQKVIDFYVK